MATIICPKCGTENSDSAMNCTQCRINLKFAMDHPEELERPKVMMADKKCPACGLWNSETALRCDCGYDFTTEPSPGESDLTNHVSREDRLVGAGIGFLGTLAGFMIDLGIIWILMNYVDPEAGYLFCGVFYTPLPLGVGVILGALAVSKSKWLSAIAGFLVATAPMTLIALSTF